MIEFGHLTTLQFWSFLGICILIFIIGICIILMSGNEKYKDTPKEKIIVDLGTGITTLGTVLTAIVLAIS